MGERHAAQKNNNKGEDFFLSQKALQLGLLLRLHEAHASLQLAERSKACSTWSKRPPRHA